MRNEKVLEGRWLFIGAEIHDGRQWQPTSYVEGMTWIFYPHIFKPNKITGNIVEIVPNRREVELAYLQYTEQRVLRIDSDPEYTFSRKMIPQEEEDLFFISYDDDTLDLNLDIRSPEGCHLPIFRYILKYIGEI